MEIIYEQNPHKSPKPKVSIILLDWSIRESFHILYYLNQQSIPREQYEIIWIEYYSKRAPEIKKGIEECKKMNIPSIVDLWIVMDMDKCIYYHKHLMYNIGILVAKGEIVTFCDSDAIVTPTFIESIIKSFNEDPNIVLHMDEFRNNDKRFYPFNYPSIEEVIGDGCINYSNGKTTGLYDTEDFLHTRNYGACMSALRQDLIKIGGADEHIDYLGHICGPYEMTFRLVNLGKKEVWHQEEFLYHVWHPGQAGQGNYLGPHDGKHMSTTALSACFNGRIMPLVENPAIKMLRLKKKLTLDEILSYAISEDIVENWRIEKVKEYKENVIKIARYKKELWAFLLLRWILFKIIIKQFYKVSLQFLKRERESIKILNKAINSPWYLYQFYLNLLKRCQSTQEKLVYCRINEVVIYGNDDLAKMLYIVISNSTVKIKGIFAEEVKGKVFNLRIMPLRDIKNYQYHILVASLNNVEKKVELLKKMGIRGEKIIII